MLLAELLPDTRTDADLRWYYTEAAGDIGLKSNWEPLVALAQLGRGNLHNTRPMSAEDFPERRIVAAARARRIARALEQVSARDQRVLVAAYALEERRHEAGAPTPPDVRILGRLRGVATMTTSARLARAGSSRSPDEWVERLCWRVANRVGGTGGADRTTLAAIRREAEGLLMRAVRAYELAWKAQRRRRSNRG